MPLIVLTASSILSVTSVSTSSGAAPGSRAVDHRREVDLGKAIEAEAADEKAPMTLSDRMMTVAKTGLLTEIEASHCMEHYLRSTEPVNG